MKEGIDVVSCENEVVKVRALHKKTKESLSTLAEFRYKNTISEKVYKSYIERINKELEIVRDLSHQLKKRGVSFDLE